MEFNNTISFEEEIEKNTYTKEERKVKTFKEYKEEAFDWIGEHPGVAIGASVAIGTLVAIKLGKHIGYKKGFDAGVEASKFCGTTAIQCICQEKDLVKMIIKGTCGIGEKEITLSANAVKAEAVLNDLKACVMAAKTGADPNLIGDLMSLPPEVLKALAGAGEVKDANVLQF